MVIQKTRGSRKNSTNTQGKPAWMIRMTNEPIPAIERPPFLSVSMQVYMIIKCVFSISGLENCGKCFLFFKVECTMGVFRNRIKIGAL